MILMRNVLATVLTLFVLAPYGIRSAAEEVQSGLRPGEQIPGPFHYVNVNGAHAGNPHCLICEFGLRPTVLVFVRETPSDKSPLTALLQKLDEAVDRYKNAELRAGVVVLSEDFAKGETRKDLVQKWEASTKDLKHVLVAVDGPDGPQNYKLSKNADVTILLYNKHKVVANFAFAKDKLTDKDVSAILAAVKGMIGVKS
jgi:hypothetical protein